MATRLSTAYVMEKIDISAKGGKAKYAYVPVEKVESGTDAQKKCLKIAGENPGLTYVAACLWPPVMAKEIRKLAYINPEDPDDEVSEVSDDVDADSPEATEPAKADQVESAKSTPEPTSTPAPTPPTPPPPAPAPAPAAKPAPTPKATPKSASAPKPVSKPAPAPKAEAPKADPPKADPAAPVAAPAPANGKNDKGYSDLFGNDEAEAAPEAFVNADEPVEKDQDGPKDAGGLF